MEAGPAEAVGEPERAAGPIGRMRDSPLRDSDRARRYDTLRAQLAGATVPEIPGWLDEAEADEPGSYENWEPAT